MVESRQKDHRTDGAKDRVAAVGAIVVIDLPDVLITQRDRHLSATPDAEQLVESVNEDVSGFVKIKEHRRRFRRQLAFTQMAGRQTEQCGEHDFVASRIAFGHNDVDRRSRAAQFGEINRTDAGAAPARAYNEININNTA